MKFLVSALEIFTPCETYPVESNRIRVWMWTRKESFGWCNKKIRLVLNVLLHVNQKFVRLNLDSAERFSQCATRAKKRYFNDEEIIKYISFNTLNKLNGKSKSSRPVKMSRTNSTAANVVINISNCQLKIKIPAASYRSAWSLLSEINCSHRAGCNCFFQQSTEHTLGPSKSHV